VGSVTFSQPIGYLEKGYDFDGTLWASERALDYFCVVGQIPILDYWFDKNPFYRIGPPGFGTVVNISAGHMANRMQGKAPPGHDPDNPDFLDKYIEAKKAHPDIVDDGQIISYLMINMIAGADTTAITIRSVLYYCLRAPDVWRRLQQEFGHEQEVVSFKQARASPYLDACIREAMRMHPPVGMLLERFVPPQGLDLPDGTKVLPGATVGLNPYIINRNASVWGEDVETFRPERWLQGKDESEESFSARLANMNSCDLTFGAGSRVCIGKHLGLVEAYKVVATLVARYNIKLVHPEKEWRIINSWFMRQEGLGVTVSRRY
jgi:cytochrome P450